MIADHATNLLDVDADDRSGPGGTLRADPGRGQQPRRSRVHRLHGGPARGRAVRPGRPRRRPRPAEPARGLPLAALRRGRGDRAGRPACRSPSASRTAGRAASAPAAPTRRSTASASRPSGSTATCSAAPSGCGSRRPSTASARSTSTTSATRSASPSPSRGSGRRTPTSSPAPRRSASTSTPTGSAASRRASASPQQFSRRLTGEPAGAGRRGRATRTTSAPATSPSSRCSAAAPTTGATIRSTPRAATISPRPPAVLRVRVRQRRARGTLEGRGYLGFGAEDTLHPGRAALVGSYGGASTEESPPDLLFFAGGGGSVRGYAYHSIGVENFEFDGEEIVVGGRGPVRDLDRAALPLHRALGRRRLRRHRPRHRERHAERRVELPGRRRRSACATTPASACFAPTSRRRSKARRGRLRGALHRHRTGVLRRLAASSACSRSWRSPRWRRTPTSPRHDGFLVNLLRGPPLDADAPDPAARRRPARCPRGPASRQVTISDAAGAGSKSTTSSSTGAGSRFCAAGSTSTG